MIAPTEVPTQYETVDVRVSRALRRIGYPDLNVESDGKGHIEISGPIETKQDRFMVFTVARTTAEVASVKILRG